MYIKLLREREDRTGWGILVPENEFKLKAICNTYSARWVLRLPSVRGVEVAKPSAAAISEGNLVEKSNI